MTQRYKSILEQVEYMANLTPCQSRLVWLQKAVTRAAKSGAVGEERMRLVEAARIQRLIPADWMPIIRGET